ncbi:MAG TPA: hypothetical protein VMW48_03950 [Vicinamibacterales bacterium]|nr:hypothetical protein [Vicinamibacterales bacterium]
MKTVLRTGVVVAGLLLLAVPALAQTRTYKVLATNKTSTMEKELKQAGELGYRFLAVMGGETGFGGSQAVVLLEKIPGDENTYNYRLLATNRTSTLEKELQEAGEAGYHAVGQTVFESMFGGKETVAIVQKSSDQAAVRYEYKLVATTKTSTLEKELREAAEAGFEAMDLTVGKTAIGGSEIVVITRRAVKK